MQQQLSLVSLGRLSGFGRVGPKANRVVAGLAAQLQAALTAVFSTQHQVERAAVLGV